MDFCAYFMTTAKKQRETSTKASHKKCSGLATSQQFGEQNEGLPVCSFLLLVPSRKQEPKEHFKNVFSINLGFQSFATIGLLQEVTRSMLTYTACRCAQMLAGDVTGHPLFTHLVIPKMLNGARAPCPLLLDVPAKGQVINSRTLF